MFKQKLKSKVSEYRFEIRHITVFFGILIIFQIILALIQKSSLQDFLDETQNWYQRHSAERLAIVTSTSMELLFENLFLFNSLQETEKRQLVASFNVIFKQQLLQKSVEDICLILKRDNNLYVIDSGNQLHDYINEGLQPFSGGSSEHEDGVNYFLSRRDYIGDNEVIYSKLEDHRTFNILVPFVPDGEYLGVMYMKISPDFGFLSEEVRINFDQVSIVYSVLIFVGLIAIFFVSSQAVRERNEAQEKFYKEHEEYIKQQIRLEKESLFTKRIYHTHHKAEKIIGFIKEDVRQIESNNIEEIKKRIVTYSNFISRIIYDMKWYDQPINTIINPIFRTDLNEVIHFILQYVFLRISTKNEMFNFYPEFDERIPQIHVNEFVVWEIIEPIVQNSIDHGNKSSIDIKIKTTYDPGKNISQIRISDTGVGIAPDLLEVNEEGMQKIFQEHESTKKVDGANSGYGCYIAYQMAVEKCGWDLRAANLEDGGCMFTFTIRH